MARVAAEPTHFLNVDLDVEGRAARIDPLVRELDRKLMCLHSDVVRGKRVAHYELNSGRTHTVESTLRGLLRVIETLPSDARAAWSQTTKREFDVGVQAGREPHCARYEVSAETVARIAALGGRIVTTVYAPWPRPRKRATGREAK
jgi:hypothetical protein